MKLIPAGHRILVKKVAVDEEIVSKGGIVIQEEGTHEQRQIAEQLGVVEALGPNAYKAFDDGISWCKVGDTVLMTKYCGEWRKDEDTGDIYQIVNDEDVLAIVT